MDNTPETTFDEFSRYRLERFEKVERHRYFNVLRYDTERTFFEEIVRVRGIAPREEYWARVVADLGDTVDDLRSAQQRAVDSKRNRLLGIVTIVGVLQVAYQLVEFALGGDSMAIGIAAPLGLVAIFAARQAFSNQASKKKVPKARRTIDRSAR